MYYAGRSLPPVMIDLVGVNVSLVGPRLTGVLSSTTIPQMPPMDQYYCGTNSAGKPWSLILRTQEANSNGELFITMGVSSSTIGYSKLGIYWLPPLNLFGGFTIKSTLGPYGAMALQYKASSDTFQLLTTQNTGVPVTLTRGMCSAAIPDGKYCAYDDTTSNLYFQLTLSNMTMTATLTKSPIRLQCTGVASSSQGIFSCRAASLPQNLHDSFDASSSSYSQDSGQAVLGLALSPSGKTIINASFSLAGTATFIASQDACPTQSQQVGSYSFVKTMQSPQFSNNTRVAVNATGTIFVADVVRSCIFTVDPKTGFVAAYAGKCNTSGFLDGTGTAAQFKKITGIAVDKAGVLYVLDAGNSLIRTIAVNGSVSSLSGNIGVAASIDGTGSTVSYLDLAGIALHPVSGRLYISEAYRIRILNQATNTVKTYVGSTTFGNVSGSGVNALLNRPGQVAFVADGQTMYFVDSGNRCLRKVSGTGAVVTIAGAMSGFLDSFLASGPPSTAVDSATGNVLIGDRTIVWSFIVTTRVLKTYYISRKGNGLVRPNVTDFSITSNGTLILAGGVSLHVLYS